MNLRKDVLQKVIARGSEYHAAVEELRKLTWDSDIPQVLLTRNDMVLVLERFSKGELTAKDVEDWANILESRDDVEADEVVGAALHSLANPTLEGPLASEGATRMLVTLRKAI